MNEGSVKNRNHIQHRRIKRRDTGKQGTIREERTIIYTVDEPTNLQNIVNGHDAFKSNGQAEPVH